MPSWEDDVRRLLDEGRKIDAIKLYREKTGAGLKEAKDWVEQTERDENDSTTKLTGDELGNQVLELLRADQKIAAIKLYRQSSGLDLKAAKEAVEALAAKHGILMPPARGGCMGVLALLILAGTVIAAGWLS